MGRAGQEREEGSSHLTEHLSLAFGRRARKKEKNGTGLAGYGGAVCGRRRAAPRLCATWRASRARIMPAGCNSSCATSLDACLPLPGWRPPTTYWLRWQPGRRQDEGMDMVEIYTMDGGGGGGGHG